MKISHETNASICRNKWPRLMPKTWAAAYICRKPSELEELGITPVAGCYDINDLDKWVDGQRDKENAEKWK